MKRSLIINDSNNVQMTELNKDKLQQNRKMN